MNTFGEINFKREESNARFGKLNSKVYKLFIEKGDSSDYKDTFFMNR